MALIKAALEVGPAKWNFAWGIWRGIRGRVVVEKGRCGVEIWRWAQGGLGVTKGEAERVAKDYEVLWQMK